MICRIIDGAFLSEVVSLDGLCFFDEVWTADMFKNSFDALNTLVLGVFDGKKMVGFALYSYAFEQAELLKICVSPEFRGKGAAKKLMESAENLLIKNGCTELFLEVNALNAAAIGLYVKSGFKRTGVRLGYYQKSDYEGKDAVLMQKNLK